MYLKRLDPDVEKAFLSLGSTFPKGRFISDFRIRKLVKLPKEEQMVQAKKLIEDAGMEWPEQLG